MPNPIKDLIEKRKKDGLDNMLNVHTAYRMRDEEIKNHKHFMEITAYLCGILYDFNAENFTTILENVKTPKGVIGDYEIIIKKLK